MKYGLATLANIVENSCLILGVFNNEKPSEIYSKIAPNTLEVISSITKNLSEEYDNIWHNLPNGKSVYIINCGEKSKYSPVKLTKLLNIITPFVLSKRIKNIDIYLPQLAMQSPNWQAEAMILQIESLCYQFVDFKTQNKKSNSLQSIQFGLEGVSDKTIANAQAIAEGIKLTKDLGNNPANICTPTYLSEQAIQLDKEFSSITTKVLNTKDMKAMGMGALLAVAQGSIEPPKLIEVKYHGADKKDPVVLVGKGITFDSGGISIKHAAGMEEMKYDMCGAASVLGAIKACALLKLPINVIGVMACAENMPSGTAIKPGDVVRSLSGQTIEITNTDAEGRLVLADALTYAEQFKPQFVIDIATLTGAVIIALGHESSGLLTNDEDLANLILKSAIESQDKAWRLPLDESFKELLESPVADMQNSSSERIAGSILGGSFLSNFTKNYRWAHLDVAGTAWQSGKKRQATGRPVPLLIQILRNVANAS